jgi:hypothetical protein
MYLELVVGNHMIRKKLTIFVLWMDNFGSHNTVVTRIKMKSYGIYPYFLPEYMISTLQVCDVINNGPLKSHIRADVFTRQLIKTMQRTLIYSCQ